MTVFVTCLVRGPELTEDAPKRHIMIYNLLKATASRAEHLEGARSTRRLSRESHEWLSPFAQYWL
jgi:hypothetical protein